MDDEYILRWKDHHASFLAYAGDLFSAEQLTDVTLVCNADRDDDDFRTFEAHRLVLSVCSPYLRSLFLRLATPKPVVFLKGVGAAELERLLSYMYTGEVKVPHAEMEAFVAAAEALAVRGLCSLGDKRQTASTPPPPPPSTAAAAAVAAATPPPRLSAPTLRRSNPTRTPPPMALTTKKSTPPMRSSSALNPLSTFSPPPPQTSSSSSFPRPRKRKGSLDAGTAPASSGNDATKPASPHYGKENKRTSGVPSFPLSLSASALSAFTRAATLLHASNHALNLQMPRSVEAAAAAGNSSSSEAEERLVNSSSRMARAGSEPRELMGGKAVELTGNA